MKYSKLPKRARELFQDLAMLKVIRDTCRELGLPLGADSPENRARNRREWKELRSFFHPDDAHKVRLVVHRAAKDMRAS